MPANDGCFTKYSISHIQYIEAMYCSLNASNFEEESTEDPHFVNEAHGLDGALQLLAPLATQTNRLDLRH